MKAPVPRVGNLSGGLLRALIVAAIVTLSLASCDALFSGMFPTDVAQITARIDLSAEIAQADAATFNFAILKLLGTEYVLLFSNAAFDRTLPHLLVLNPALKILNRYTMDDLETRIGGKFMGSTAVTRLKDTTIIIGNLVTQQGATGLDIKGALPEPAQLWSGAIEGPAPGYFICTGFRTDSTNNLVYDAYNAPWATPMVVTHPIGKPGSVRGVFTDPDDSQNNTALIVFDDSATQYFIQVPKVPDLAGGWPAASLLDNTQYLPFTKADLQGDSIAVTSTGIVAYDTKSQSWIRFLPSTPDQVSSMNVGRLNGGTRFAFSYSGGYFCAFDARTRVLTAYADWW